MNEIKKGVNQSIDRSIEVRSKKTTTTTMFVCAWKQSNIDHQWTFCWVLFFVCEIKIKTKKIKQRRCDDIRYISNIHHTHTEKYIASSSYFYLFTGCSIFSETFRSPCLFDWSFIETFFYIQFYCHSGIRKKNKVKSKMFLKKEKILDWKNGRKAR